MELPPSFPADAEPSHEYDCSSIPEALDKVAFGDGLAVLNNVGLSAEECADVADTIRAFDDSYLAINSSWQTGMNYYCPEEPEVIVPVLDKLMPELSDYFGKPYDAVNMQLNVYEPGSGLAPHYDEEYEVDNEPAANLGVLVTLTGEKDLVVWPHKTGETQQDPVTIRQKPGQVVLFRAGAFRFADEVYPSLQHGVPSVTTEGSQLLTFSLWPQEASGGAAA